MARVTRPLCCLLAAVLLAVGLLAVISAPPATAQETCPHYARDLHWSALSFMRTRCGPTCFDPAVQAESDMIRWQAIALGYYVGRASAAVVPGTEADTCLQALDRYLIDTTENHGVLDTYRAAMAGEIDGATETAVGGPITGAAVLDVLGLATD